jgi:hypothetical protein
MSMMFPRLGIGRVKSRVLAHVPLNAQHRIRAMYTVFFSLFELALQSETLAKNSKSSTERDIIAFAGS